ncbi:MAG: glycosyltransferase family 4 protein [Salinibacter sp.]|uniref:glycosyltransferase family 4 protein n=1 Tax=Salinibacter sp. TaxID=2065818 RepID=UPI0035D3E29D
MNILFVLPEFPPQYGGGIATYYKTLLPAIAAQGHAVDVLVGSAYTSDHPRREEQGYSVEFLDVDRRTRATEKFTAYEAVPPLRRTLGAAWALFQQADRGAGYDLIETTDFGLSFLPWVTADDTPPVLVQLHASNGQIDAREPKAGGALQGHLTRLLELQGLSRADMLQSHSHENVRRWRERLNREVGYLPPPLPPRPQEDTSPSAPDTDAVGFVAGRIQYWKGPTVLCEAQQRLGPDAPLIDWAGRDTDYRAVGHSMSDYLADRYPRVWRETVRPIGEIPPEAVARRQNAAQFVVVPSIWDVFNYTTVEALREGSVVICSDGAGACDVIDEGENGFVVPADQGGALAGKIETVLGLSSARRKEIGRAGRETVRQTLSPERVARRRSETYDEITKGAVHAPADSSWLAKAIRPKGAFEVEGKSLSVLDRLPLRDLTRYVIRRAWKKIVSQ